MNNSQTKVGVVYTAELAELIGLDPASAIELDEPLKGAVLEIYQGNKGRHLCALHVLYDSTVALNLPDERSMIQPLGQSQIFPYALITNLSKSIRAPMSKTLMDLSNRALFRMGREVITKRVSLQEDVGAAYSSMPLNGYTKDFVPGVSWLSMPFNCAAVTDGGYDDYSLWLEKEGVSDHLILSLTIEPSKMVELKIPGRLIDGMKPAIEKAMQYDDSHDPKDQPAGYVVIGPGKRSKPFN